MATYRLIRKLAAGGMAEVFLAKVVGAEGFEKPVAVKRILPSLAQDREFVELFLRETLYDHPNRPRIVGKRDERGEVWVPAHGELDAIHVERLLRTERLEQMRMSPDSIRARDLLVAESPAVDVAVVAPRPPQARPTEADR